MFPFAKYNFQLMNKVEFYFVLSLFWNRVNYLERPAIQRDYFFPVDMI
jgi:hypothetical protein